MPKFWHESWGEIMDFTYNIDIRELRHDELIGVLLRLGMRSSMVGTIFKFNYARMRTYGRRFGVKLISGRLPTGGLYAKSPYGQGQWTPIARHFAVRFYVCWIEYTKYLDEIRAFILAWQKEGGDMLDINRCWVLTQRVNEVRACKKCGNPFLREHWMILQECQVCNGGLLKSFRKRKAFKHLTWQGDEKQEIADCLSLLETKPKPPRQVPACPSIDSLIIEALKIEDEDAGGLEDFTWHYDVSKEIENCLSMRNSE